jgi:hypothetical protein
MAGGRPTLFTDELMLKAWDYVNGDYETIYAHGIPSHLGLCEALGITKQTLYRWRGEDGKGEFSDMLDFCLSRQHNLLIGKGLSGDFNSTISKLVLSKHGYADRVEQSGVDGGSIKTDTTWTIKVIA